ncbi:transposable element Tcb1 transposase [Trichonephila clavipes]|nr:transposable element Tcb1 transposase [Trichonephila clavipes]
MIGDVAFSDESRFMLHRTMDVGVHGIKPLKARTLRPLPELSRLETGALWSGECFPGILWVHSSLWKARWINISMYLFLRTISTSKCALFSLLTYQQDNAKCHTANRVRSWFEEHQAELTILPWPANSPDLSPSENLWDHLRQVVRGMDPHPRILA